MNTMAALYVSTGLLLLVAVACSALCLAWTIPAWRQRMAVNSNAVKLGFLAGREMTGWSSLAGSLLISILIAGVAAFAWYGLFVMFAAAIANS